MKKIFEFGSKHAEAGSIRKRHLNWRFKNPSSTFRSVRNAICPLHIALRRAHPGKSFPAFNESHLTAVPCALDLYPMADLASSNNEKPVVYKFIQ